MILPPLFHSPLAFESPSLLMDYTRVKVAVKTQKTCVPGLVAITTLVMSLHNTVMR